MTTRPTSILVESTQPQRLAGFWADGLGWTVRRAATDEVVLAAAPDAPAWDDGGAPELSFVRTSGRPEGRNRIHLDVVSSTATEQHRTIERLLTLGARRIDIGQDDVPWEVLADPDGNELCVLEPREAYAGRRGLAAVVVRCTDPQGLGSFWSQVTGWPMLSSVPGLVAFTPPGSRATRLELLADRVGPLGGPRLRIGVTVSSIDDLDREVARLERAGARRAEMPAPAWVTDGGSAVVTDPEDGELVLFR